MIMVVAELLHKTESEIYECMSPRELARWIAYLNIKVKERNKPTKRRS